MDDEELEALERESRLQVFTVVLLCFGGVLWGIGKLISLHFSLIG